MFFLSLKRNRTKLAPIKRKFATAQNPVLSYLWRQRIGATVQRNSELDHSEQASLYPRTQSVQFAQFDCDRWLRRQFPANSSAKQSMHNDEHRHSSEQPGCNRCESSSQQTTEERTKVERWWGVKPAGQSNAGHRRNEWTKEVLYDQQCLRLLCLQVEHQTGQLDLKLFLSPLWTYLCIPFFSILLSCSLSGSDFFLGALYLCGTFRILQLTCSQAVNENKIKSLLI